MSRHQTSNLDNIGQHLALLAFLTLLALPAYDACVEETYLTTGLVADKVGKDARTVIRWVKNGTLPVARITPGGTRMFALSDVNELIRKMDSGEFGNGV